MSDHRTMSICWGRATERVLFVVILTILALAAPLQAQWVANGVPVSTATSEQSLPVIVSDGAGGGIIAWQDYRGGNYDIYARRIDASGVVHWTDNGVAICATAGNQSNPTIASDGAGGAIIAWHDTRNGNYDIYARRIDASGAAQWTANGAAICTSAGDQFFPTIVSDGAGGAIITWYDNRSGHNNIYAQRIDSSGAVQWAADGVAVSAPEGEQYNPVITGDGADGAIITWQDQRSGYWDVYAQRLDGSGIRQWNTHSGADSLNGVAISAADSNQAGPVIARDGAGGAIIAWFDNRYGGYDIYAQRIDSTGAVQWTADGVSVCSGTGDQTTPALVVDGTAGTIIAWKDHRSGLNDDIYARRVDASGAVQWTADGVAISTAAGDQTNPAIAGDGANGAIITWKDYRSGSSNDVYAQRIDYLGAVQWAADGAAISTAANNQMIPTLVSDGAGGAIITWYDSRSSNWDIYAQRTSFVTGVSSRPQAPQPTVFALAGAYPNPSRGQTTIAYQLLKESAVKLEIYNLAGQKMKTLVADMQPAGNHRIVWQDNVSNGIYFFRLNAGGFFAIGKVTVLK